MKDSILDGKHCLPCQIENQDPNYQEKNLHLSSAMGTKQHIHRCAISTLNPEFSTCSPPFLPMPGPLFSSYPYTSSSIFLYPVWNIGDKLWVHFRPSYTESPPKRSKLALWHKRAKIPNHRTPYKLEVKRTSFYTGINKHRNSYSPPTPAHKGEKYSKGTSQLPPSTIQVHNQSINYIYSQKAQQNTSIQHLKPYY